MSLAADVRAALSPVIPQGDHPYLSTADGMGAITATAATAGARTAPVHVRTGEYVVATFTDSNGNLALARSGDARVAAWHREELDIAAAWAEAGAPVAPPRPGGLLRSGVATVSLWDYVPHSPGEDADPAAAGHSLARLHAASTDPGVIWALRDRPFRAPGKIGRRLLALSGRAAFAGEADTLLLAAATVARLTARLPVADTAVHGDFQPGNWLTTPEAVVAIDVATACTGPRVWDLTLLEGRCGDGRRYPRSFWVDFCAGYGVMPDVLDDTAARQLRTIATAVAALRRSTQDDSRWAHLRATCHT